MGPLSGFEILAILIFLVLLLGCSLWFLVRGPVITGDPSRRPTGREGFRSRAFYFRVACIRSIAGSSAISPLGK